MPPNFETEPLMYQGISHAFCAPTEPMRFPSDDLQVDFEGEVVVVTHARDKCDLKINNQWFGSPNAAKITGLGLRIK